MLPSTLNRHSSADVEQRSLNTCSPRRCHCRTENVVMMAKPARSALASPTGSASLLIVI